MANHPENNNQKVKFTVAITAVLCLAVLVLAVVLAALAVRRANTPPVTEEINVPLSTVPVTTWPEPIVTADGRPSSLLCLDSYSIPLSAAGTVTSQTVATCSGERLTNDALQIYYVNAISTYRLAGSTPAPDFSQPLDRQLCPLGDGNLTWQHYFLQQAIDAWQLETLLLQAAEKPRPIQEEAYKPNETDNLHGKYVAADLPVNGFLYQNQPCYKPNSMHQAYLDGLEEQLEQLVQEQGYQDLADYAETVFGSPVSAQELVDAAVRYNTAYMFFTEESYETSVTEEEIDQYLDAHGKTLADAGEDTVDVCHILLIPEGAKISADGTVKAAKRQWEKCEEQAENLLLSWEQDYITNIMGKCSSFTRLANQQSQDAGSRLSGGLYRNIRPGQLTQPLDEWCFDEDRQPEDTAIIRSKLGYHVVFFCSRNDASRAAAREILETNKQLQRWQTAREENPVNVNYTAVQLWADCTQKTVSPVDVLYPDVAHERFPEVMVYFQQDYMYSRYGGSYVGRGGCGITTMAMLATYMTDTILSPDMLATRYPNYHDASGTRGEMFIYVPAELGFFLEKTSSQIDEVIAALENGQRVISLQHKGHFTSGGHFLLLQQYYAENDTFQVRDSNIYNYGRLEGHKVDYFTRENVLSGGAIFYIMQNKITRISACCRCGDGSAPEALLEEDYLCEKCIAALSRRNHYLALMSE